MNREIKFRAWKKQYKSFIYSDWKYGVVSFWDEVANDFMMHYEPTQQYTGLKDKNGKEIYEGDIITYVDTGFEYDIRFEEAKFVAYHSKPEYKNIGRWGDLGRFYELYFEVEVIGNIYENPELLNSNG